MSVAGFHRPRTQCFYIERLSRLFSADFHGIVPDSFDTYPYGDVCVIVGMDWLIQFGARIDCEGQRVVVQTRSGGKLTIYGEGTWVGLVFCSFARDRQYLHHRTRGTSCMWLTLVLERWFWFQMCL